MSPSPTIVACCSAVRIAVAAGMALAGLAILTLPSAGRAAEAVAFTIPDEEGYGIAECMQAGNACGQAMASSWCAAHGHAHVAAFGLADDVTGSTPGAAIAPLTRAAVVIRCDD